MDLKLTIFSVPKSFLGNIAELQENAIKSWLALGCKAEIILCGNDFGVDEACQKYGLIHIPDIKKNDFGTYFLDDVFINVEKIA